MKIGSRKIARGEPVYLIAELSANHGGKLETALRTVRAAKESGAHAIKLQTYTADTMTLPPEKKGMIIQGGTLWDGRSLYELYQEAATPWEWHAPIKRAAEAEGLDFFSTPFDPSAIDFLESLDVVAHKVASFEIVDLPLIRRLAKTGKPLIISTGLATFSEIKEAVETARTHGAHEIALLKCTSAYPSPFREMNLQTIPHLAESFGCPAGLSDHTLGITTPIAATALGATIIEKHFILSRDVGGPDSSFSLEPHEFRKMADSVREAQEAIGTIVYEVTPEQKKNFFFRRSLYVTRPISKGEAFTPENTQALRPASGLAPRHYDEVLTKHAACDIEVGTPLTWELIV